MVWADRCEGSFQKLKSLLCREPVLRSPDFTKQFILQTDASDMGVGAVLSQLDEEGADHPVAYYSRTLLAREQKYATIEKECLAITLATQAFRVYLLGRPFIIQTDRRALEWLDRQREQCETLKVEHCIATLQVPSPPSAWKGQRQCRLPFPTFNRMTSVEEKGEGMWRTEQLCCNGDFPHGPIVVLYSGRIRPAL